MSDKIYKNQTKLQFNFSTGADITGQTTTVAILIYPAGSTTTLTCTVTDASTGAFNFSDFTTTTLKTIGTYKIYPDVTFSDDKEAPGNTYDFRVFERGK